MPSSRRTYDHRLEEQVVVTGNRDLFPELKFPRSTALSWIRRGMPGVVALDDDLEAEAALRARVAKLEHRIDLLTAVLRLVLALLRVSGFKLERSRLPDAGARRKEASRRRLERNQKVACGACPRSSPASKEDVAA